jgi:hypothetical protein
MPGQNPVVAEHYPDHFHTLSFPLHGSTITRGAITPLLQVEKRQMIVDDVRLITRVGVDSLTIDVGFMPGATPIGSTWTGTYTCSVAAGTTVTIASTTGGSLSVGDRLVNNDGSALTNIPVGAYIASFGTYTVAAGTGTVVISAAATGSSTGATGAASSFKSILKAPISAATANNNTVVVADINYGTGTLPTTAPNSLEVTTPNNVVPGPISTPATVGAVLGIEARGAATTNFIGTLQIRYRDRLA